MRPLFPKPTHDMYGRKISKRKAFKISTKRQALRRARYKCEKCGDKLRKTIHKKLGYVVEFDHRESPSNNGLHNCWVLCPNCHREVTVVTKRRRTDRLGFVRYETIQKRADIKRKRKKKAKSKKKTRKNYGPFVGIPRIKF